MAESEELYSDSLANKLGEKQVQCQKQDEVQEEKVIKVDLRDDGNDSSSSSDKSFEVGDTDTTEISAHSNSHGSQTNTKNRVKKHGKRRHKGGSRHKRHLQYQSLRDEAASQPKQKALQLQEKENAAAIGRLAGEEQLMIYPAAPFNSTQFLMEEHSEHSPHEGRVKSSESSVSSSPQHSRINSVPLTPVESNHETIHFPKRDQEFTDSYISAQAECLQSLPKAELVKHFMHLEEKVAALQKKVAAAEHKQKQEQNDALYSKVDRHVDNNCVCESVYNSETNSLSSNNEDFVDLSEVNQQPACVEEPSLLISHDTVSSSNINFSSSGGSS